MSETKTLWACPDGSGYTLQVLANAPGFSLLSLTQILLQFVAGFRETFFVPYPKSLLFQRTFYYNKYT